MITYKDGDLLEQEDLDILIHQANCFCMMGGGIAKAIANKWPHVYKEDMRTGSGYQDKLGNFSYGYVPDRKLFVCNMYSQFMYGATEKRTEYWAMIQGLRNIKKFAKRISCTVLILIK